jgi:hypothetical protein
MRRCHSNQTGKCLQQLCDLCFHPMKWSMQCLVTNASNSPWTFDYTRTFLPSEFNCDCIWWTTLKQNDHTGDLKTSENSRSFLVTRVQHHWVSLLCRKLFIQNAPENPRDFLVRPEVRAMYEVGRDWKSPRNGMMIHQYHPLSTMTHIFKVVEPTLGPLQNCCASSRQSPCA